MTWKHSTEQQSSSKQNKMPEEKEIAEDSQQSSSKQTVAVNKIVLDEDITGTIEEKSSIVNKRKVILVGGCIASIRQKIGKRSTNLNWREKPRMQYSASFRAKVIKRRERGETVNSICEHYSAYSLNKRRVSSWMQKKERIMKATSDEYGNLFKIRESTKY